MTVWEVVTTMWLNTNNKEAEDTELWQKQTW